MRGACPGLLELRVSWPSFVTFHGQWKRIPQSSFLRPEPNGELGRNCAPWTGILVWVLLLSLSSLNNPKHWRFHRIGDHNVFKYLSVPRVGVFTRFCDTRLEEVAKKEYCALIDNLVPGWRRDAQLEWGSRRWQPKPSQSACHSRDAPRSKINVELKKGCTMTM